MADEKKEKGKKTRTPSAKKRDIQSKKRQLANSSFKAEVRTAIRSFETALTSGDKAKMQENLSTVYSLMDKGVKIGQFKQNKAARTKSRLTQRVTA